MREEHEHTIAFYAMKELNGCGHFSVSHVNNAIASAIHKKGWVFDADGIDRIKQKVINALNVKGD